MTLELKTAEANLTIIGDPLPESAEMDEPPDNGADDEPNNEIPDNNSTGNTPNTDDLLCHDLSCPIRLTHG
jgi:hypothetical protein